MTEVLMTCTRCDVDIVVDMDCGHAAGWMSSRARMPSCSSPALLRGSGTERIAAGTYSPCLLVAGVSPLRVSEPTLPSDDRVPGLGRRSHETTC